MDPDCPSFGLTSLDEKATSSRRPLFHLWDACLPVLFASLFSAPAGERQRAQISLSSDSLVTIACPEPILLLRPQSSNPEIARVSRRLRSLVSTPHGLPDLEQESCFAAEML